MRILFLTSGLGPGQDGVGDYTRRLALACVRQNQECRVIALNDPQTVTPVEAAESLDGCQILTLRLPARLPWEQRVELARAFRAQRPVDWTSLQFVPYGFQRKGVVGNLARRLAPITAGSPLHLMFHELWLGIGQTPPLRDRLIGQIQRHYIRKLVGQLKPRSITTSNPFYLSLLKGNGIPAAELPLFGNIPVSQDLAVPEALVRAGICDELGSHPDRWLGLFFGTLHPEWKPEPLMNLLNAASEKTRHRICLISAGRWGASAASAWKKLQNDYSSSIAFIRLGEQPSLQVSTLLQVADFGLATSPWHLIGKSGAAAAMLDHGLPVIVTRTEFQPAAASSHPDDPLLHRCDAALEAKLVAGLPKRPAHDRVDDVARDFIRNLTETS